MTLTLCGQEANTASQKPDKESLPSRKISYFRRTNKFSKDIKLCEGLEYLCACDGAFCCIKRNGLKNCSWLLFVPLVFSSNWQQSWDLIFSTFFHLKRWNKLILNDTVLAHTSAPPLHWWGLNWGGAPCPLPILAWSHSSTRSRVKSLSRYFFS